MKKILNILILAAILFTLVSSNIFAKSADFTISSDTNISYTTNNDYVAVTTTYTRAVNNSSYYDPATGEKVFNIPDLPDSAEDEIDKLVREKKKKSQHFILAFCHFEDSVNRIMIQIYL